jgi:hypothetical protein
MKNRSAETLQLMAGQLSLCHPSHASGKDVMVRRQRSLLTHVLDVADEIANDFHPVDIIIREFHARKAILDGYHQFKTVEPVGPEIVGQVRFIRDTRDADAKLLGNERADRVDGDAFFARR